MLGYLAVHMHLAAPTPVREPQTVMLAMLAEHSDSTRGAVHALPRDTHFNKAAVQQAVTRTV
jgi:hypothetical protein